MSLNELAERVAALEGPCRETDAAICGLFTNSVESDDGDWWYGPHDAMPIRVPDFTASLDAAMALAPVGLDRMVVHTPDYQTLGWTVGLVFKTRAAAPSVSSVGRSQALALTAACLRALSALGQSRSSQGGEG